MSTIAGIITGTPVNWEQVTLVVGVIIAIVTALSAHRRSTNTEQARQTSQSEQCKFDHSGIRAILVEQGANLSRLVDSHTKAVSAFSDLAHSIALNHKDTIYHHTQVLQQLGQISQKLDRHRITDGSDI